MGGKPNNKQEKETPLKSKSNGYNKEQMIYVLWQGQGERKIGEECPD